MTDPKPKRHWFRFSLRTLLVVVTLAAAASWGYWVAWPWQEHYREQQRVLDFAMQLKSGIDYEELDDEINDRGDIPGRRGGTYTFDSSGVLFILRRYEWPNVFYFVVARFVPPFGDSMKRCRSSSIETFRVHPTPADYQPQTELGRREIRTSTADLLEIHRRNEYAHDCLDSIAGNLQPNPGFEYELIYSDPPAR